MLSARVALDAQEPEPLTVRATEPYLADSACLDLLSSLAYSDGNIPTIAALARLDYGFLPGWGATVGVGAAHFSEDATLDASVLRIAELKLTHELPSVMAWKRALSLVPYIGAHLCYGEPYLAPPPDGVDGVLAEISVYGDPGLDIVAGLGAAMPVLSDRGRVHGYVEYGYTRRTVFFPDSWDYANRLRLDLSPSIRVLSIGDLDLGVALRATMVAWLSRGFSLSAAPQLYISGEGPFDLVLGAEYHVLGGAGATYSANLRVRLAGSGERRIRVSDLHFPPDRATLLGPGNERSKQNERILRDLYRKLARYPDYTIIVEGHTSFVYWDHPVKGPEEQRTVLIPLSQRRAEAVRRELVAMGIAPDRISAVGKGGSKPLVPFSAPDSQWKNRRVEIILVPPRSKQR